MIKLCKKEICTGCSACANACPNKCIEMKSDEEGFLHPVINVDFCVECGRCVGVCPATTPLTNENFETSIYAAKNLNESVRLKSTSGGVFTKICEYILERDGVVFGAAFDKDFKVQHIYVEQLEEIEKLRTAKYAQSKIGSSYREVLSFLSQGRWVLFSGTPCQISGLLSFLGKSYNRLITVDLVCLGTPSPDVWEHYIRYRSVIDANGNVPENINLRCKDTGWARYSVRFDYLNGIVYSLPNDQDPYLRAFVQGLCMRPSCYKCELKGVERNSDFTLGDYWGVWSANPEMDDGKGVSIVLVHTEKAEHIWHEISSTLFIMELKKDACFAENPAALRPIRYNESRTDFMMRYKEEDFSFLVNELAPIFEQNDKQGIVESFLLRIVRKVKQILYS